MLYTADVIFSSGSTCVQASWAPRSTGQPVGVFVARDDVLSKAERLAVFFDRLERAAPPANHDEAMQLLTVALNDVEDEFSGIPSDPSQSGTDGRMYPPEERFRYTKWERPGVFCYRQVAHATFVAENGAVEIRSRQGADLGSIAFEKPGKDKRKVSAYESTR